MATERVTITEREDGGVTYVDHGPKSGLGGVLIGIALLALVAVVAFFLLNANHNDALRTDAVTSAASSIAGSTTSAAKSVGDAVDPAR